MLIATALNLVMAGFLMFQDPRLNKARREIMYKSDH